MKFVVDSNLPFADKAFGPLGEVVLLDTAAFTPQTIRDADVLVIRSETKITPKLLKGSRVGFVGTASIGTDHVNLEFLESEGIAFAGAPGCNANSVKEYLVAALLDLSLRTGRPLRDTTLGVVGVGNVGHKVAQAAAALGMTVLHNDPPRARAEGGAGFVPLDDLMGADIVTLHVPLTTAGADATHHLFDSPRILKMKRGAVLINTARGAVFETQALNSGLAERRLSDVVLDVWENEPEVDAELLSRVFLGTAHIAGYSWEGKVNAVRLIREAVCRHFRLNAEPWDPVKGRAFGAEATHRAKPEGQAAMEEIDPSPFIAPPGDLTNIEDVCRFAVKACYDIVFDDRLLRRLLDMPPDVRAGYFRRLRTGYRLRREFSNATVRLNRAQAAFKDIFEKLGFSCCLEN